MIDCHPLSQTMFLRRELGGGRSAPSFAGPTKRAERIPGAPSYLSCDPAAATTRSHPSNRRPLPRRRRSTAQRTNSILIWKFVIGCIAFKISWLKKAQVFTSHPLPHSSTLPAEFRVQHEGITYNYEIVNTALLTAKQSVQFYIGLRQRVSPFYGLLSCESCALRGL